MARENIKRRREVVEPTPFEQARDEMFQQVMRCGVIGADTLHQAEWFGETMAYLAERYHELTPAQIGELRLLGERFVQPPRASQQDKAASAA